jgi:hypothetical protein
MSENKSTKTYKFVPIQNTTFTNGLLMNETKKIGSFSTLTDSHSDDADAEVKKNKREEGEEREDI